LAGDSKYAATKTMLQSAAPASFAKPGPASNKLRLKVNGETFCWEPK